MAGQKNCLPQAIENAQTAKPNHQTESRMTKWELSILSILREAELKNRGIQRCAGSTVSVRAF